MAQVIIGKLTATDLISLVIVNVIIAIAIINEKL